MSYGVHIPIRTRREIEAMRDASRHVGEILMELRDVAKPGITTGELDRICHNYIVDTQQAVPAPLNYRGFPKSICTSVNHVVCHGIPGERQLKSGDAVNIDITVIKDGFHGDTSRMFFVGKPTIKAERLARIAYESMWLGIEQVAPGKQLGDIGHAIQSYVEQNRFSVVREYCGHGIGRVFHEDPQVLHYGDPGTGMPLKSGMTLSAQTPD